MAFTFPGNSIGPGQQIRLYFQFNNYQYAGPKVIQASPYPVFDNDPNLFLITSDIGHEQRNGNDSQFLYVYSLTVRNVSNHTTYFNVVGGDVS